MKGKAEMRKEMKEGKTQKKDEERKADEEEDGRRKREIERR